MATSTGQEVNGAQTPKTRYRLAGRKQEELAGWAFGMPAIVLLTTFIVIPFALAVYLSFTDASLRIQTDVSVVGTRNYTRLWQDPAFRRALINNVTFAAVVVPLQTALSLWLALLVNRPLRGRSFFRTAYFAPVVTVAVVAATVWQLLLADFGLLNSTIDTFLGSGAAPSWLRDSTWALPSIMVVFIWRNAGFQMVVILAGLQGIPRDQYEAAFVDGATRWQVFRHVTLPGLRNTLIFVITITVIFAFRLFDEVQIMTQGGPRGATHTLMLHLVEVGFGQQRIGQAAGVALIFFALVLTITLVQRALLREDES